jgi:hypothetical protein
MKNLIVFIALISAFSTQAQTTSDGQIQMALLAAPESSRAQAAVYGYDQSGKFIQLRKGQNELICLADDPAQKGLNVSCYHKDLEPFMARGRQLKQQGKNFQEVFDIREKEAKSGKLKMPKNPSTLFVYTADEGNYDLKTAKVEKGYLRYVVYIPFATSESTGLPLKPEAPGMPWIMDPGTHRAHIMINPPMKD